MDFKSKDAVVGIFDRRSDLETAVESLKSRGFEQSDISVLMPSREESQKFAHEKGTKAPEGAAAGATGGVALGGILGWLAGAGALAIPGVGPFVAAGPIMAAIAGAGIGGALGGVTGALVGLGIPEYEARRYEDSLREGGYLISVHVDDSTWEVKARDVLKSCGARDISLTSEKREADKLRTSKDLRDNPPL